MAGYLLLALCMAFLAPHLALGANDGWTSSSYPNPLTNKKDCKRDKNSYLCDPDGILSKDSGDQLAKELEILKNQTECPCLSQCQNDRQGFRMGIALLKKMAFDDPKYVNDASDEDKQYLKLQTSMNQAQLFAYHLLNRWNMDRCGDDLILVYSEEDNVLFTFTGEQTQNHLSPSAIAEITLMEKNKIGRGKETFVGLRHIVQKYRMVLQGKYKRRTSGQASAEAAAVRQRRNDQNAGTETTAAFLITSIASIMASLALHW